MTLGVARFYTPATIMAASRDRRLVDRIKLAVDAMLCTRFVHCDLLIGERVILGDVFDRARIVSVRRYPLSPDRCIAVPAPDDAFERVRIGERGSWPGSLAGWILGIPVGSTCASVVADALGISPRPLDADELHTEVTRMGALLGGGGSVPYVPVDDGEDERNKAAERAASSSARERAIERQSMLGPSILRAPKEPGLKP